MISWSDEEFLTVAEVAARLQLNQQTIRNWIDAGTLPAVRVGRRVRVLQSDFDKLIQDSYQPRPQARSADDGLAVPGPTDSGAGFQGREAIDPSGFPMKSPPVERRAAASRLSTNLPSWLPDADVG
jgi:excisionase family DNA binding protein